MVMASDIISLSLATPQELEAIQLEPSLNEDEFMAVDTA